MITIQIQHLTGLRHIRTHEGPQCNDGECGCLGGWDLVVSFDECVDPFQQGDLGILIVGVSVTIYVKYEHVLSIIWCSYCTV